MRLIRCHRNFEIWLLWRSTGERESIVQIRAREFLVLIRNLFGKGRRIFNNLPYFYLVHFLVCFYVNVFNLNERSWLDYWFNYKRSCNGNYEVFLIMKNNFFLLVQIYNYNSMVFKHIFWEWNAKNLNLFNHKCINFTETCITIVVIRFRCR